MVEQLQKAAGPLDGKTIEVHAGAAYTDAIRDRLRDTGAHVLEPLTGLTLGQRLAWYGPGADSSCAPEPASAIEDLIERLRDEERAQTPAAFLDTHSMETRMPGLYSWWVDSVGAPRHEPLDELAHYDGISRSRNSLACVGGNQV